ncbi:NAD(P)/FAD-dependent oxidoreductase [Dongia deserti]|nr:NAD(P)/FAD-dependent oxidoreductase [Dongia deserti]
MSVEKVEVLVVGGGQAGIAMSEHLSGHGIQHLVVERGRIAERWRTGRWDSLVANGPAWHDRFPGMEFSSDPDGFPGKDEVADYFVAYAQKIAAPIRCGVAVAAVTRNAGRRGFRAETSGGTIEADHVIAATGPFQTPVMPGLVPEDVGVAQIHSADYRNPAHLRAGAVLVVGTGSSGVQIADELQDSGRRVSSCRSGRMGARRAAIADRISAGGWGCSTSGMPRPCPASSTPPSRSAGPKAGDGRPAPLRGKGHDPGRAHRGLPGR